MPQVAQFIRKTSLAPTEYQTNFTITDNEILDTITSDEALQITKLMPSIYLRLRRAPTDFWEREGVLRFVGGQEDTSPTTAWDQMRQLTGVANSTLSKALSWLHEKGIIGYSAHKNGIGIRIFFNRANSSIRARETQKNLRLVPTPSNNLPAPSNGVPFKEEISKKDLDNIHGSALTREEQIGAGNEAEASDDITNSSVPRPSLQLVPSPTPHPENLPVLNQAIKELKCEFSNIVKREIRATQDWFYDKAIPKAIRIAQRETFNLLRSMGVQQPKQSSDVGKHVAATEQGNPNEALAQRLGELGGAMKTIATASENTAMASVLQSVSLELDTLGRKFYADEIDFQVLEEHLDKLERAVATAIWDNTESSLKETLLRKGEKELQKYEQRMNTIDYRQLVEKRATYALFEHYQIPRFSLFYL